MSTSYLFSVGLLISFLLFISCSSIYRPNFDQDKNNPLYGEYNSNEDNDVPLLMYPKSSSAYRFQRSSLFYPRANRNSWFRVSTYQHMKPTGGSEEKPAGDHPMRWG